MDHIEFARRGGLATAKKLGRKGRRASAKHAARARWARERFLKNELEIIGKIMERNAAKAEKEMLRKQKAEAQAQKSGGN